MSRLGGGKLKIKDRKDMAGFNVHKYASMADLVKQFHHAFTMRRTLSDGSIARSPFKSTWEKHPYLGHVGEAIMTGKMFQPVGDTVKLADVSEAVESACDRMINDVLIEDPRLARKPSWVHAEEGLDVDVGRFTQGDECFMLDRRRTALTDTSSGERMRIVISTDSNETSLQHAAAFMAAAKLAQQFRPIEIWWQGSWLVTDGDKHSERGEYGGHVFLVPLVTGDLDLKRLLFALGSQQRDAVSFYVMTSKAWPEGYGWSAGRAQESFLENTDHFLSEAGIRWDASSIARIAARWAGLESRYQSEVNGNEAEQWWRPKTDSAPRQETETERRKRLADSERWAKEEAQKKLLQHKQRMEALN